ncbi:hypothetical protein F7725_006074 [Dissostichus mawsoni]|uniref:Malate dehydrogenase n=1 Tax=Dissostichus mawsoni TaxID=36200 RepID=A0A7J5YVF0_DISMA|nr:hypothetical protein F7725_006074 [Dissostichus mawsoni]
MCLLFSRCRLSAPRTEVTLPCSPTLSRENRHVTPKHLHLLAKMADPIRVVVTGAAGQIAYSLLYSIAKGDVFGKEQPITLILLDIPPMLPVLEGVVMELQDCALPLLREVIPTDKVEVGFKDIDAAILVGSMPRKEGMERKDLLKANVAIFKTQGSALDNEHQLSDRLQICSVHPKENFSCLTRLDHNRASSQVAMRCGVSADKVKNVIIWGNHSSSQYPDVHHAKVTVKGVEKDAYDAVKDEAWLRGDFISAICDHMRDIWFGTKDGEFISMGVYAGGNSYGIPEDLIYSFPIEIKNKTWKMVGGLPINDFSRAKMDATAAELVEERDTAMDFLSQ